MRAALLLVSTAVYCSLGAGCGIGESIAMKSTSKIILKGQASMQMEADYELARMAIPGSLKTVEAFWVAGPPESARKRFERILTEGYCQYGTAFVEDDWEVAKFKQDVAETEYHNARATNIFTRCLNFALRGLGDTWQKNIFGDPEVIKKMIAGTGSDKRFYLLFAANALGSLINHNLTRVEMFAHLSTVQGMMARVIEIDAKSGAPSNKAHAALPHIALGMIASAKGKAMGGDPEAAKAAFEKALAITDGKFLLARTLMAYRVGLQSNDRKFFHDNLVKVLETPPSVWPEQRLANEVAHRRARRYLSHEKDLFQ
jgi:hypothetical protein